MNTRRNKIKTPFGEKLFEYMEKKDKTVLTQQDLCWKAAHAADYISQKSLASYLNKAIWNADIRIPRSKLIYVIYSLMKFDRIETFDQANELLMLQRHLPLGDAEEEGWFELDIKTTLAVREKEQQFSSSPAVTPSQAILVQPPNYDFDELQARDYAFLGRDDALEQMRPYLTREEEFKLLTIWGISGEGKTALTEAALEMYKSYWKEGIVAISLEKTKSREKIIQDLARFLGLTLENKDKHNKSSETLGKEILENLKEKQIIIVLDNFETLSGSLDSATPTEKADAQQLRDFIFYGLLNTQSRFLVTSQKLTFLPREISIFLSGLNENKGAELFLKCTNRPTYASKEEIESLSKKIGGHPLSLRLLGQAYSKSLSSFQVFLKEWEKSLFEAEDTYKKEDDRNRSVYASIYHSIQYLESEPRRWLSILSIFQGPFLLETAIQLITRIENIKDPRIVSLGISELISSRLLLENKGPIQLLRLQAVLHLYLKKYLLPNLQNEAIDDAFCSVHQDMIVEIEKKIGDEKTAYLARQTTSNFEAVEGFEKLMGVERGRYRKSWGYILFRLNQYDKSLEWLTKALEDLRGKDNDLESFVYFYLGNIALIANQLITAESYYINAINSQAADGDRIREARLYINIGRVYRDNRMFYKSMESFDRALRIFTEIGDMKGRVTVQNNIGRLFQSKDRLREALVCFQDALAVNQSEQDSAVDTYAIRKIGEIYQKQGRIFEAQVQFEEAVAICRQSNPRKYAEEAITLNNIARICKERGDFDLARKHYEESLSIRKEILDRSGEADVHNNIGRIEYARENLSEALTQYQKALDIYRDVENREGEAITQQNIGLVFKNQGNFEACLERFECSFAFYKEIGDCTSQATVYNHMGMAYSDDQENEKALVCFERAFAISLKDGHYGIQVDSLQNIALTRIKSSDYTEALSDLERLVQIAQANALLSHQCGGLALSADLLSKQPSNRKQAIQNIELALEIFGKSNLYKDSIGNQMSNLYKIRDDLLAT